MAKTSASMALKAYKSGERAASRSKSHGRRRSHFTLPVAVLAGFGPLAYTLWQDAKMGSVGMQQMTSDVVASFTGYNLGDGKFHPEFLLKGTVPILLGLGVHKAAGALGVNRALGRAKIPFLRI